MTPGNNGASTPEDDDPFGYLYADGQANGATPPSGGGYGYPGPRSSVNRVRAVGERQYTPPQAQQQTAQYGQVPQQGGYGSPNPHYAAPEATGAPVRQSPPSGGRGRGPNTRGLLIGAIAVVAAVVIGIGVAMISDGGDKKTGDEAGSTPSAAQSQSAEPSNSASASAPAAELPKSDAKALRLEGNAQTASDVEGARSAGGVYVGNLNSTGSGVTWTVDDIPKAGTYTLFVGFDNAGDDQAMSLLVNGEKFGSPISMKNYTGQADPERAWTTTYVWPTLNKGTNTLSIICQDGDKCDVLLDQVYLKAGKVKR